MPRILCIDYGSKRSGIAVTDPTKTFAFGLKTVSTQIIQNFLVDYFIKEEVDEVVVGEPKRLHNQPSEIEIEIQKFLKKFKSLNPTIKLSRHDERFTSKMAFQTMIDSGLKKKQRQNKALIDEISATVILQSYLEYLNR